MFCHTGAVLLIYIPSLTLRILEKGTPLPPFPPLLGWSKGVGATDWCKTNQRQRRTGAKAEHREVTACGKETVSRSQKTARQGHHGTWRRPGSGCRQGANRQVLQVRFGDTVMKDTRAEQ